MRTSSEFKTLSIIFLTYGERFSCVEKLMATLEPYPDEFLEVIAIDNNSTQDISGWLTKKFSFVKAFRNKENIGTARAYNIGIRLSKGRYIMLVNDDCYLKGRVAEEAVDFLELHPEFAGLGLSLLNPDGTRQLIKLQILSLWPSRVGKPQRITFVGTNNFLCRREVFKKVGLFDENYFFFNEDLDWSWRAWKAGVKIYYRPELTIYHGRDFLENSFSLERFLVRQIADLYFYKKNLPYFFKFIKVFYKTSLKNKLKKIDRIELYPKLKRLLNVERPNIQNNIYDIQKTLINGEVKQLLSKMDL